MKKLSAILLSAILVLALSACEKPSGGSAVTSADTLGASQAANTDKVINSTAAPTTQTVTREEAIEKALAAAGLTRENVRDLEAELDKEFNGTYWEVDFESGGMDYSYDIDATTGEIVRSEIDPD